MAIFRFFSWILIYLAIALMGGDLMESLEQGEPIIRSTAEVLALIGIDGYAFAEASPGGVSQALSALMSIPLWTIIGLIGIVLTLIFRPIE